MKRFFDWFNNLYPVWLVTLAVESAVLDRVREAGVRTPRVFGCDASRSCVPFAWQALARISALDLNHWFKAGTLEGYQSVRRLPEEVLHEKAIA
jgi:hypothetical protein